MILDYENCEEEFETTIPGKQLRNAIKNKIENDNLIPEMGDVVFTNAARNYLSISKNPKIKKDNELRILLEELPVIFSLLDIVEYPLPVTKSIFLVSTSNCQEVADIFTSKKQQFEKIDWLYNGNEISIFIHIEHNPTIEKDQEIPVWIGNEIFKEIENRRIRVGFYTHRLSQIPKSIFGRVHISGSRALGITKKIGNFSSGFREDIGFGFRSAWEANFARILNYLQITWEYEKDSFPLVSDHYSGYYFPDFFLPNNLIVEIKGFWDNASRAKVMLFMDQYPEIKLITIDSDLYYDLDKKFRNQLSNWEESDVRVSETQIQIVGISRPERRTAVESLGIDEELFLSRDKDNQYDNNAIKVLTKSNQLVGYVAKDWACILAQKMDCGVEYFTKIKEIETKVIQLLIRRSNTDIEIMPPCLLL